MRKKYFLISLVFLGFLIFNRYIYIGIASDEGDNDNIDDDFEELNKRDIEIHTEGSEILIDSIRRNDNNKDEIRSQITYDEEGLKIEIRYRPDLESEFDLEFGIIFRELIEFVDINQNGIYEPEIDQKIQEVPLNEFRSAIYESSNISNNTKLHYIQIQTENEIFIIHIYFAEEFALVEQSLVTPTQAKIDIEISHFIFINESSNLALDIELEYEGNYEEKEETEDEKEGFAEDEEGVATTINDFTGFFTWKRNATIDGISKQIHVSEVKIDKFNEHEQSLYINYPKGEIIYHDPKIGIENILISLKGPSSLIPLIILISVIGAVSVSAAYAINYYGKHKITDAKLERDREDYFNNLFENNEDQEPYDGKLALQILSGENAFEKLSQINNINITALSEDFFEIVNCFEWESQERSEFILEMLALAPLERQLILDEMLKKSYHIRR
ncbi:MAG: hypothetical protein ACFFCV_08800 [Promethearchaeota archaeon]